MNALPFERKRSLFSAENLRTIFDLDGETNPFDQPLTLLKFDDGDIQGRKSRPLKCKIPRTFLF